MSFLIAFFAVSCVFYTSAREDCGRAYLSVRIVGGIRSVEGAWPWLVALTSVQDPTTAWCTGFLIDRKHILTAAHCFEETSDPSFFSARVGSTNTELAIPYDVESIRVHEEYTSGAYDNDIALLKLYIPANLDSISPICLPIGPLSKEDFVGETVSLAGWGSFTDGEPTVKSLYELRGMPIVSNDACNLVFGNSFFSEPLPNGITEGHICAGFPQGGKDGCKGDSGAPLMYQLNDRWYAIGLTSFGYECGLKGYPGGYTRVSKFLEWIYRVHYEGI